MRYFFLVWMLLEASTFFAQSGTTVAVADQTLRLDGTHEFAYALAEGDVVQLRVQLIAGRQIKSVEFVEYPTNLLFRAYQLDTLLTKDLAIPHTGVYVLRITESGMGKKIGRFTLQRTPASPATQRMDTRIGWDIKTQPEWAEYRRLIEVGRKTNVERINGQTTVPAAKMGINTARTAYFFTLPPNTVTWAYRIGVGQSVTDARRADAQKFSELTRKGATKVMAYQPETALAAFALGMAVDLTVSTAGEDVEYILADGANTQKFLAGQTQYDAFIWQGNISVDVQRRFAPLVGMYAFSFKNNNWFDDINVQVDIEAVTETPITTEEIYLLPK
jgi:hypothetical protein